MSIFVPEISSGVNWPQAKRGQTAPCSAPAFSTDTGQQAQPSRLIQPQAVSMHSPVAISTDEAATRFARPYMLAKR